MEKLTIISGNNYHSRRQIALVFNVDGLTWSKKKGFTSMNSSTCWQAEIYA